MTPSLKKTPLHAAHVAAGAKLIEFGGWEMPVYYTSITDEHLAVRNAAGIFDISHMGEIFVKGRNAESFLNYVLTNNVAALAPHFGQYTLMCNERGGAVDDLYVYRLTEDSFLLIVNASRVDADYSWLCTLREARKISEVTLENASEAYAAVAIQGPRVRSFIDQIIPAGAGEKPCSSLKKNEASAYKTNSGSLLAACTGYTGEDGFEIVCAADAIQGIWEKTLEAGREHQLRPCGLGARDTLRTEVCYPLYGHELDEENGPAQAGLGHFVRFEKPAFVGRDALLKFKNEGTAKKLAAFRMTQRSAPPRAGYAVRSAGENPHQVGAVTSGTQSPCLNAGIGMAFLDPAHAVPGAQLFIDIRGKLAPAEVVRKPIYRKP